MVTVPSATWRALDEGLSETPSPEGLDAIWGKAGGVLINVTVPARKRRFEQRVKRVLRLEKLFTDVAEAKLREQSQEMLEIFRLRRDTPEDMERAFALIREVADRLLGERPYPVQILGAFALEAGCVAEMATGEGKTLTATLPATIAGWRGKGCHIITVNDYLAQRDAEWMGRIYRFCGLSVAHIEQSMEAPDRRAAYAADITYCTNKEVTADFLRDRIALGHLAGAGSAALAQVTGRARAVIHGLVQRGLVCAIVDEADSVLIDEAVTPLIISGPAPNLEQLEAFRHAANLADSFSRGPDYGVNHRYREVELTPTGREHLARITQGMDGIWTVARRREEILTKALVAKELYSRDKHYVLDDGKVVIVDDFTGRLMHDRTWREGLHQAVEAKEGLEVTPPKDTYARISFQRFFRLYHKLAGMTGTAKEASYEFWHSYHLPVITIPPNRPCIRKQRPDMIFASEQVKWERIVLEIRDIHKQGRPILIGTRSVKTSEHLSELLQGLRLEHKVLNAVRHREEAQIVAEAGQHGHITVATNMAGRGTDIKLGRGIAELGGLHVIAAERNESGRIDRQLFGRCARQGDPGSAQAIVSLDDELVTRYGGPLTHVLRRRYAHSSKNITSKKTRSLFALAQYRAQRAAVKQRKNVTRTDHWLDENLGFSTIK
jgi:preprotein translocase subunit SecA